MLTALHAACGGSLEVYPAFVVSYSYGLSSIPADDSHRISIQPDGATTGLVYAEKYRQRLNSHDTSGRKQVRRLPRPV